MIQSSDYFKQSPDSPEITDQVRKNAAKLLGKVCRLLSLIPIEKPLCTSGFRTKKYNSKVKGSPTSHHMTGNAIDIHDPDKKISEWCMANEEYLREEGLHIEHPDVTCKSEDPMRRWTHFQIIAPASGKVVFWP